MVDFGETPPSRPPRSSSSSTAPSRCSWPAWRSRSRSGWACSTSASRGSTAWPRSWRPPPAAAVALPGPVHLLVIDGRGRGRRRGLGRHRRVAQGHPRRERGDQLDHAQLRRARAGVLPAHRPVPRQQAGRVDHQHRRRSRRAAGCPGSTACSVPSGWPSRAAELYGFLIIAIVVGVLIAVLVNRTRFGFDLRASGLSPSAASASGVNARGMVVKTMLLSGAVAGLIGLPDLLGDTHAYTTDFTAGLGFLGIAVALLGRNRPGGIALAALLFAFLDRALVPAADRRLPRVGGHDHPGHHRAGGRGGQRDRPPDRSPFGRTHRRRGGPGRHRHGGNRSWGQRSRRHRPRRADRRRPSRPAPDPPWAPRRAFPDGPTREHGHERRHDDVPRRARGRAARWWTTSPGAARGRRIALIAALGLVLLATVRLISGRERPDVVLGGLRARCCWPCPSGWPASAGCCPSGPAWSTSASRA